MKQSYRYNQRQEEERSFVLPADPDVLCGRGKECFHHNGNVVFRHLIVEMLPKYVKADSKKQKMYIIRQVVDRIVAEGGRFLKKDVKNQAWFDGGTVCGKDKVGHAFRDAKVQERRGAARLALKQQTINPTVVVNQQDPAVLAAMSLLVLHRSDQCCVPLSPDKSTTAASLSVAL